MTDAIKRLLAAAAVGSIGLGGVIDGVAAGQVMQPPGGGGVGGGGGRGGNAAIGLGVRLVPDDEAEQAAEAPVFVDESPVAAEGLARAREHRASGNLDAASDVLQKLLEDHGQRVTASADDARLYVPLRQTVHTLLASDIQLLERYRQREANAADELLKADRLDELVRTRMLTRAGIEGVLRLSRRLMLDGHVDAAALQLGELATHPDAADGPTRARVNELAKALAKYVRDPAHRARLADVSADSRSVTPIEPPETVRREMGLLSGMQPAEDGGGGAGGGLVEDVVPRPIGSTLFVASDASIMPPADAQREDIERLPKWGRALRWWPAVDGPVAVLAAGPAMMGFDRLTGRELWRVSEETLFGPMPPRERRGFDRGRGNTRNISHMEWEDVSAPTIVSGTAIGIIAQDPSLLEEGSETIVGVDPANGAVRWHHVMAAMDRELARAFCRGPVVGDSGVAVVSLVKNQTERRLRAAMLAGFDATSGRLLWTRLVGSTGVLPGMAAVGTRVADAATAHAGVVYRADRMGVVSAYRIRDGEPLWLRVLPTRLQAWESGPTRMPWTMPAPVVGGPDGRSVIILAPDRKSFVELDSKTGAIRGQRPVEQLGDAQYALGVRAQDGSWWLGFVNDMQVRTVRWEEWTTGEIKASTLPPRVAVGPPIRGRVTTAGGQIVVPTVNGVRWLDPANPQVIRREMLLDNPGTVLVSRQGLLVVDDARVHTYSSWEFASASLLAAVQAGGVNGAAAAAEVLSLAERSGRAGDILPATSRAVGAINAAKPVGEAEMASLAATQVRVIELAVTIAQRSAARPGAQGAASVTGTVIPGDQIEPLLSAIEPLASTARERATFLLARAEVRSAAPGGDLTRVVADVQTILDEPALAAAPWAGTAGMTTAQREAERRLGELVRNQPAGRAAYGQMDQRATQRRAAIDAADVRGLEALARQYPAARIVPEIWLDIAAAHRAVADSAASREGMLRALEMGIRSAEAIGDASEEAVAKLHGQLVESLIEAGQLPAAHDALVRASGRFPQLRLIGAGGAVLDVGAVRQRLVEAISASIGSDPAIGSPSAMQEAQVFGGWSILEPLIRQPDASAAMFVVMQHADGRTAVFGPGPGALAAEGATGVPAPFAALWTEEARESRTRPDVLSIDARGVVLFYGDPGVGTARLMRIDVRDGRAAVAWKTEGFGGLFPQQEPLRVGDELGVPRVAVPVLGDRPASEMIGAADARTIVMVERTGRAAAYDASSGIVLWTLRLPVGEVQEISLGQHGLLVAGVAREGAVALDAGGERRVLISRIDPRAGTISWTGQSPVSDVRWIRQGESGAFACGMQGTVRLDLPASGQLGVDGRGLVPTTWALQMGDAALGFDAWLHEGGAAGAKSGAKGGAGGEASLLVLSESRDGATRALWRIAAGSGKVIGDGPLDTRNRLETSGGVDLSLMPGGAVGVRSGRGLVIVDGQNRVAGADAISVVEMLVTPQRIAGGFVTIIASPAAINDAAGAAAGGGDGADVPGRAGGGGGIGRMSNAAANILGASSYALVLLDDQSAKVTSLMPIRLAATPQRVQPLAGRLAVSVGHSTVLIHAPARPGAAGGAR
ncbi:MAG: PQQ-binding-like beta-propeller repeat protein [Phycisphaerales bacterium]|jgi:hypothetical protein|nr:PQQ-binding-like beta-propeller repeat protein [Phycisphaerales bacterium]